MNKMSTYKWKKNEIINSDLKDYTKSILLNELNNIKDDSAFDFFDASNYNSFKEAYIQEYNTVKRLYPELVDYIDSLDTNLLKSVKSIRLPFNTTNSDLLLKAMENMIVDLEDRNLINEYAEITNSNKKFLNIEPTTLDNLTTRNYVGRCISENNSKDTYISLYTNNDLTDFTNLAHEFGHAFEHRLFLTDCNPIIKNFLSEISSIYFELLMMDQVNNELNVKTASDLLNSNKLLYITRNILVNQMSLFILFQNKFDINSLSEFYKDNIGSYGTISTLNGFYLNSYLETINYITSYMIALKLYNKTKEDKYEGFDTYKNFMTDPTTSLNTLLNNYDLNFINNNESYKLAKIKSEITYKKLLKK